MADKYVRPTVGGWLRPAMFGPWITIWTAATLYAWVGPEYKFMPRLAVWVIGLIAGGLVASIFTLIQVLVDVTLLALRQRSLPTGRKAWMMSLGAPALVLLSYALLSPVDLYKYGPWAVAAAILGPMIVTAFGVRIFAGPKIEKTK